MPKSDSPPPTTLLDLPTALLIEALSSSSLGAGDIANAAISCKELRIICDDNAIWLPICKRHGLAIADSPRLSGKACAKELHGIKNSQGSSVVRFHGLYTDAGVDGNKEIYSLDHMYQPNNWAAYCSEITPANTLAYIKGPNAWEDAKLKDHRAFLLARLTPACTQLFGHHRLRQLRTKIVNARTEAISSGAQTKDQAQSLSWVRMNEAEHEIETCVRKSMRNWITSGLEQMYIEMYQMMVQQVAFGSRLRQGMAGDHAHMDHRLRSKYQEICKAAQGASSDSLSQVLFGNVKKHAGPLFEGKSTRLADRACLIDLQMKMREVLDHNQHQGVLSSVDPASPSTSSQDPLVSEGGQVTHVGLIHKVTVSRAGEFTCPLRCGAFFLGSPPTPSSLSINEREEAIKKWSKWDISRFSQPSPACQEVEDEAVAQLASWTLEPFGSISALDGVMDVNDLLERVKQEKVPKIAQYRRYSNGEWVEFEQPPSTRAARRGLGLMDCPEAPDSSLSALAPRFQPIAWFRFFTREELRQQAQSAVEQARHSCPRGISLDLHIRTTLSASNKGIVAFPPLEPAPIPTECIADKGLVTNWGPFMTPPRPCELVYHQEPSEEGGQALIASLAQDHIDDVDGEDEFADAMSDGATVSEGDEEEDEGGEGVGYEEEGEDGHLPLGFEAPDPMEGDDEDEGEDEDDEEEGEGEGEDEEMDLGEDLGEVADEEGDEEGGVNPFEELLMNIMVPGVEDAPAMMHLLMSLSRSVGLMCIRQMNMALSETSLRLQARWSLGGTNLPPPPASPPALQASTSEAGRSEPSFRDLQAVAQEQDRFGHKSIKVLNMDSLANGVSPVLVQPDATLFASKNILSMHLLAPRAGSIASVKLISCEDRMREFGDEHEHQNVDVQYVVFHGATIELPPGCHLDDY